MSQPPMTEEQRQAAVAKNDARNMDLLVNSEKRLVPEERQILDQIAQELGKKHIEARACLNNRSCVIWMEKPERQYKEYFSPEEMEMEGHVRELKISAYAHDKYATGQLLPYKPKPPIHQLSGVPPDQLVRLFELIGQLPYLAILDLSCNEWSALPDTFYTMANRAHLVKLDLTHNELNLLQAAIENFRSLQILFLGYNKLSFLPNEFGNLENLRWLHLNSNKLCELPSRFGNLSNLSTLNLVNNAFTEIPIQLKGLTRIFTIYLDENKITLIPSWIGEIQSLVDLGISNNKIKALPDEIFNLRNLKQILVSPQWLLPFFRQLTTDYMDEDFAKIKPQSQDNPFMVRWKTFIPRIIEKIKNGESIDEWEQSYPFWVKYEQILQCVLRNYRNETSKLVEELVNKQFSLKVSKKKKIIL